VSEVEQTRTGRARIDDIFADLRARQRRGLIPFVVGQHPAPGATSSVLPAIDDAGASIIEVGIPFSDPLADGPVIAGAMHEALTRGATPDGVLEEVASVRPRVSAGLVAMVSVSVVYRCGGPEGFASRAAEAGFDGLIVPDVPFDESAPFIEAAHGAGLAMSLLVAPGTPSERAGVIAQASTGFIYLVARSGVTGEGGQAPRRLAERVGELRSVSETPIAVGFGISTPEQVRAATHEADAAIVGSALVRRLGSASDPLAAADSFVRELVAGLAPAHE